MEDLKKEIKKIVDIAKECPENLQQTCFEILLRDFLDSRKLAQGKNKESKRYTELKTKETITEEKGSTETEISSSIGSDLILTDLHVKARKFMEKYKITVMQLNTFLQRSR